MKNLINRALATEKKLFILLATALMLIGCGATSSTVPTAKISGDLSRYQYVYVVPTSGVTSGGGVYSTGYGVYGGDTHTVNPSELITGYLMKLGYSVLPSLVPDLAEHTIVVTYGNTGTSSVLVAKSGAIIQVRDAKTHQLIATSEAEGTSLEDETYAVKRAIYTALDNIFSPTNKD